MCAVALAAVGVWMRFSASWIRNATIARFITVRPSSVTPDKVSGGTGGFSRPPYTTSGSSSKPSDRAPKTPAPSPEVSYFNLLTASSVWGDSPCVLKIWAVRLPHRLPPAGFIDVTYMTDAADDDLGIDGAVHEAAIHAFDYQSRVIVRRLRRSEY
jgi:hypothetical protein